MTRKYGVKRDVADARDKLLPFDALPSFSVAQGEYSIFEFFPPVKDQLELGSCEGNSTAVIREVLYRAFYEFEKDKTVPKNDFICSPLFVYYKGRELEGTQLLDGGMMTRTACRVANRIGLCLEKDDPYKVTNYRVPPTPEQIAEAGKYKIGAYHRVQSLQDIKDCILAGLPVNLCFGVYESFDSRERCETGMMSVPDPKNEEKRGEHSVVAGAFNDNTRRVTCRNHWGIKDGDKGNFYMPYEVIENPELVGDCWMMHMGKPWRAHVAVSV